MRGYYALGSIWVLSLLTLAIARDFGPLEIGLGFGAFSLLIAAIVRATGPVDREGALRIERGPRTAALGIAIAILIIICLLWATSLLALFFGAPAVPGFTALATWFAEIPIAYPARGLPFLATLVLVVLPVIVVRLFGVRLREIGLCLPTGTSRLVTIAVLVIPLGVFVTAVGFEHVSIAAASLVLVMNFLNNGLPEEVFFRGVIMSYLRGLTSTPWAVCVSAIVFSLFHVPISTREEHNIILLIANPLAENIPLGVMMSWMALRTRSLALPIIVHFSIDALRHVIPGSP